MIPVARWSQQLRKGRYQVLVSGTNEKILLTLVTYSTVALLQLILYSRERIPRICIREYLATLVPGTWNPRLCTILGLAGLVNYTCGLWY